MKNKKLLWLIIIVLCIILGSVIFLKISNKTQKTGNTKISKTVEGITEYILNMSSYEANLDITVVSNKNETKYKVKQSYVSPNVAKQVVLEPSNIRDLTTTFDGANLKIENSKLNLSTIYENYQYLTENHLFLQYFAEDYKVNSQSKALEKDGQIILETKCKDSNNKYQVSKKLYIDKDTVTPIKMEVQDYNQNTIVYILYNEIEINSTNKEDVLAFRILETKKDI